MTNRAQEDAEIVGRYKEELAARDARILELHRQGVEPRDIANEMQLTLGTVRVVISGWKKWGGSGAPSGSGALLRYDAARQALAEARSYDEVREWEDKAAAIREYARRSRNRALEIDAAEIRVRAERRRGELLAEMRTSGVLLEGRRKKLSTADDSFPERMTLADLDTTADESSRAQKLAAIAPDAFERLAARCRERLEVDTRAHAFDVLRERDGPVNGARSVMGSRQEPDDSLDYFPTPPWATRALAQHVLPAAGIAAKRFGTVWEPACGEGHMAAVLEEYAERVIATDIFNYGYGDGVVDFSAAELELTPDVDWIISNPPFGDLTETFVLRGIERARVGVAMFVRLQWLESVGRYEAVFRDHPPTLLAFFAERVPLCKGRWDPDGSTATAYIWLVWIKGVTPKAPFWIPPGQREALTKPADRDRFTAHPVLPIGQTIDGETYDPATGEIEEIAASGPDTSSSGVPEEGPVAEPGGDAGSAPSSDPMSALEIPAFLKRDQRAA